ncbi:uncharacterized protein [Chelonus insularis]|uniref:uncharacterized protein isoform X2 n=1 Tax=Chelonus insularis TaxID=460826 RepID=UPI00158A3697|nr:uncharacterized protein LOC118067924 isoform X2 [Chelonus insularis]
MFSIRLMSCLVLFFFVLSITSAVPVQLHEEPMELNEIYASPEFVEALARTYAAMSGTKGQSSGDNTHAVRRHQSGRLLSSVTFGDNRDFDFHIRKPEWANSINGMEIYGGSIKRNIDEIDRSSFDNFVKRNFDEIDRSGWDSFVKRRIMNAYLASRPH